jgi:membrane-associated phospholipid phosphatase
VLQQPMRPHVEPDRSDRPLAVAPAAGAVDRWATSMPRPLPGVAVLILGYVGMALALIAVGEALVHWDVLAGFRRWDDDVSRWVVDRRTGFADTVTGLFSRAADTMGVIVCALLVEIVLALRRRWWALLVVPIGLGLELLTFLTVNTVVDRPRPDVLKLGSEPSTSSFPSGHIAATVVLWGAVALLFAARSARWVRTVAWTLVLALALAVGASRVYRGMHHPTDVVAGLLMGAAALAVTMLAVRLMEQPEETSPVEEMRS